MIDSIKKKKKDSFLRRMHSLHSLDSLAQGNESIRRKEIVPWPIYRSIDLYRLIDRLDRKLGESWLRLPPFPSIRRSVSFDATENELLSSFSLLSVNIFLFRRPPPCVERSHT